MVQLLTEDAEVGGMSADFTKCNIRIPSEPTESSLIIMTAVERLTHEAQASLLGT